MLFERDTEVAWLEGHVDGLARGCGGAALALEGPAGVGKTTLLKAAQERARGRGVRVVASAGAACESAPGELGARLVREAATTGPTLVTVDDVHRADATSLRELAALATEVAGRDIVLLTAGFSRIDGAVAALKAQCELVELEPLSPATTAMLMRRRTPGATDAYCAATHTLTHGMPRFVVDLTGAAADAGLLGSDREIGELARLAAGAIARGLWLELGRLGEAPARLAQAIAILGDRAGLGLAARVAELTEREAADAADLLHAAGLVDPDGGLRLRPDPVAAAIVRDLPRGTDDRLHRRAARELARANDIEGAVDHLVQIDPAGDPDAARTLHAAAAAAGDPGRASELLERALSEPPAASLRPAVLRDLGLTELALGLTAAREHLAEALGLAPEDVRTALALARSHLNAGDAGAAMDVLTRALDGAIEDPDLRWRLEAELGAIGLVHPARWLAADRRLEGLPDSTTRAGPGARQLAAVRAFAAFRRSAPVALVRRRAMAALVDREPDGELLATLAPLTMLITVLAGCDELAVAQRVCDAGQCSAARRGDRVAATVMAWYRARCAYSAGDLHRALAGAVTFRHPVHAAWVLPIARAQEAITYLALGRPEAAANALSDIDGEALSGQLAYECILRARGALRLVAGDHASAASAFGAGGDLVASYGIRNPAGYHHGGGAALALARLGALDRAREIAGAEHEQAQAFGAAGTEGRALWVLARLDRDPARLRVAADMLGRAGALGVRARALADLGDVLLEQGCAQPARQAYHEALDLADRGGAVPLATRSREGLRRVGARPRRARVRGIHALTPAERRTADLAARGLTNAAAAAALFVSVKTVEGHLRAVYRKLGIAARGELAAALADPDARTI